MVLRLAASSGKSATDRAREPASNRMKLLMDG
jgi:hypothetical protein